MNATLGKSHLCTKQAVLRLGHGHIGTALGQEGKCRQVYFRWTVLKTEAPMRAEFLQKRLISAFFGFQWQNLAEILHLFKKYNNIGKVAVKRVSLTDYAL